MDGTVQQPHVSKVDAEPPPLPPRIRAWLSLTPPASGSVWLTGAFWAICDQGVWSLTTFLFNLYLVGELGPHRFGVYSVAFSVLLVVNSVQNSLLLEPMSVISAAEASRGAHGWKEQAARMQTRFGLLGAVALGGAAAITWKLGFEFAFSLAALSACFPFLAAVAFRRRVAYMESVPFRSVRAGIVNLAAVFIAGAVCRRYGVLTPASAFLIFGLAAILSLLSISKLDSFRWHASSATSTDLAANWSALWRYGKWSGASAASGLLGSVLYPPILAATSGYEVAGLYKSMEYLFLPANQALTAVCVFSLPRLSSRFRRVGLAASRKQCVNYVAALVVPAFVYSALALLFFGPVARLVMGAQYARATWMVPFLGFTLVLRAFGDCGIGVILRADLRPNAIFLASLSSSLVVAVVAYPLCRIYGAEGLLYGSCAAAVLQTGVYIWFLARESRHPTDRYQGLTAAPL